MIANALDEQALTETRDPEIFRDAHGRWHVRDWGRGLRYEHLTQNENKEKLAHPDQVVGKFGVGLKDALATFDRHRVAVVIRSRYGDITTGKQAKHGFADIKTLHALITESADPSFTGTEFILHGDALGERQVEEAKALFLRYSGDEELGVTPFGTVLRRANARARARIYVNGLRVAEEDNFLFSYNITSPTAALRRALNRERSNVGRSAYTDRVKSILLACDQDDVIDPLVADLQNYERGTQHDETQWLDVGLHTCKQLNARRKVIFLTAFELAYAADFVQRARVTVTRSSSCPRPSAGSSPACATPSATPYATWTATATSGKTASASPLSTRPTSAAPNERSGRRCRGSSRPEEEDPGT